MAAADYLVSTQFTNLTARLQRNGYASYRTIPIGIPPQPHHIVGLWLCSDLLFCASDAAQ